MNPELIIVHSPHGTLLSSSVALYGNSLAAGSAEWEGHWKEFDVSDYLCYYTCCAVHHHNSPIRANEYEYRCPCSAHVAEKLQNSTF